MEATVWIPIVLSCVMAIVAIITLAKNTKKDNDKEIDVGDLKIKVIEIERDVRSAHKRLDDMQNKG